MIWQKVKAYWRLITATSVGVIALATAAWTASGYVFAVDDWKEGVDEAVVVAQVADTKADQALEWQRLQMEREKTEARAERKKWREIVKLCMDGTIKDQKVCAEAMAALK
jgi:hypothetical protein